MAIEMVDKNPLKMVDLSSSFCKRLPEGIFVLFDVHPDGKASSGNST